MAGLPRAGTKTAGSMCLITRTERWHTRYQVRLLYQITHINQLIDLGLLSTVRAVAFSPGGSLLAAAGDSRIITLFDVQHGEQVANLTGHSAWVLSIDWSDTGEYLLSGAHDGKAKVWSIDRRACVATHSETENALWAVKWLPKTGKSETFATAGANRSISFYREATSS